MWLSQGLAAFIAEIFTTRRPTTELLRCVLRPFRKTCPVFPVCQVGGWVQHTPAPIPSAHVLHTMASHRSWLFTSGSLLRLSSPPEHAPYPTSAWQYMLSLQIWNQMSNPSGGLSSKASPRRNYFLLWVLKTLTWTQGQMGVFRGLLHSNLWAFLMEVEGTCGLKSPDFRSSHFNGNSAKPTRFVASSGSVVVMSGSFRVYRAGLEPGSVTLKLRQP